MFVETFETLFVQNEMSSQGQVNPAGPGSGPVRRIDVLPPVIFSIRKKNHLSSESSVATIKPKKSGNFATVATAR